MGTQQLQLFCSRCNEMQAHNVGHTNHVLHLLLTVFTVGLWLIVWFIIGLLNAGSRAQCARCGARRGR